jgi:transposase
MKAHYLVELTETERSHLQSLTRKGKPGARRGIRARILLLSDQGKSSEGVVEALGSSHSTVYRTRRRFVEGGLDYALNDAKRPGGNRKLSPKDHATLVALACSKPPDGRGRWTLKLLSDGLVALTDHDDISAETIRRRLHELDLKPWQKRMWCIAKVTPQFIAQMEHILDLYAAPPDPKRPLVCFDETLKQLVGRVIDPLPAEPGNSLREDHHYRRNGITHLAMFFAPHLGWREVRVLRKRDYGAFAHLMKELVDVHFPEADAIQVVMDNLNVHCEGALYRTFPPEEARRILRRLEFNFTPVHASWLNMVEIEIGVLARQCLDQRIGDRQTLAKEVAAWNAARNDEGATIKWLFTVEDARRKLARHYPEPLTDNPIIQ